jgi:NADH-quinone oxidoreductase subunit H
MEFIQNPVHFIAEWLRSMMAGWGFSDGLITFVLVLLGVVVVASFVLLLDILLVWVERKVVARLQDRLGPNRLGPFGLIQPLADVIKLLIKEDIAPEGHDRVVYNLAPILALATVLIVWAVIPFGPNIVGADINVGVLFIVAAGSLGILSIIMAGWASNNKYALLGAFRTIAVMVSFEIPMVIVLLVPVILARTMAISGIVEAQNIWYIVLSPLAALIFLLAAQAELGRAPFDLSEAESEIVAGFHIEYTGMKFGLFYAGELLHALTFGAIFAVLFLGGWRGPGVEAAPILGVFYLFLKSFLIYFVIMWIKYSMPRIRIDHMLSFCWKFLTPLALALVIVIAILSKLTEGIQADYPLLHAGIFLLANLVIIAITIQTLRRYARMERKRVGEPRPVARPSEAPAADIL